MLIQEFYIKHQLTKNCRCTVITGDFIAKIVIKTDQSVIAIGPYSSGESCRTILCLTFKSKEKIRNLDNER